VDLLVDPDYALIVRAEDLGDPNALSSTTRVNIVIIQNLWVSPAPIAIRENLDEEYPMYLTTVSLDLKTMLLWSAVPILYIVIHKIKNIQFYSIEVNTNLTLK